MPPRQSLTSSFSVSDAGQEVVCPLRNQDGSACRKRCLGEKRFRSMQEHIRRAHPEFYISKLPATEESFWLMVNSPPHERPPQPAQPPPPPPPPQPQQPPAPTSEWENGLDERDKRLIAAGYASQETGPYYADNLTSPDNSHIPPQYRRGSLLPAANAAAALAQLHSHRPEPDAGWEPDHFFQEAYPEIEPRQQVIHPALEQQTFGNEQYHPTSTPSKPRELAPNNLQDSPPGRSSTLPPLQRSASKSSRPRKSSVSQNARRPKHERTRSKDHMRRLSHDRKALSAEPQSAAAALYGKRWEDLIDAATSATEEDSRDLTPIPGSPHQTARASLPPLFHAHGPASYTASPLQRTLTPPPNNTDPDLQPFPSVESSIESGVSGKNFHISGHGLLSADSSPNFSTVTPAVSSSQLQHLLQQPTPAQSQSQGQHQNRYPPSTLIHEALLNQTGPSAPQRQEVQIYCAACRRLALLRESYACTECICGLCQDCVDVLVGEQSRGRPARCPRCGTMGGKYKPFQLDVR